MRRPMVISSSSLKSRPVTVRSISLKVEMPMANCRKRQRTAESTTAAMSWNRATISGLPAVEKRSRKTGLPRISGMIM